MSASRTSNVISRKRDMSYRLSWVAMRSMPSTIILTHGGGRFGNQLIQFGHLLAMAEEQGDLDLINYSFWPYADLCAGTSVNPLCFYSPAGRPPPVFGNTLA